MIETHRVMNHILEKHPIKHKANYLSRVTANSDQDEFDIEERMQELVNWIDGVEPGHFVLLKTGYHLDCLHQKSCRRRFNKMGGGTCCWMFTTSSELYLVTKEDWDKHAEDIKAKTADYIHKWEQEHSMAFNCECKMKDRRAELYLYALKNMR